jgi:hypothetical protein
LKKAQDFWQQFADSEAVLKVLSGNIETAREYGGTDIMTSQKAIALSLALRGPKDALEIATSRIKLLESMNRNKSANEIRRWLKRLPLESY